MTKPITVLLADDMLIARAGWQRILELEDDIEVAGEAVTAQEAASKVLTLQPDIVLMDLDWFGDQTAGITAIAQIKRVSPQTRVIAVTAFQYLIGDARKMGADGALSKGFSRQELLDMIRSVQSTTSFQPPASEVGYADELTSRELEILALLADGLSDKEVALELAIVTSTVKNHVRSILSKLGARDRTQAVSMAFRKGLLR
ncbi:MAG: response regulator transcription factor [Chloroflexota bacterium]|nr:response regulator transcription factor [Chloroflexota bacterium]MDQ5867099.1 response regulator transcription factor [Chloroflexota bacterium]